MHDHDDRSEITELVSRLGICLDEGRFDELRHLVTEEARIRTPGGQAEGRAALIEQAQRNHPRDQRFQHVITNVVVDADGDRATVRANLVVHITIPDEATRAPAPPLRCAIGEVYHFDAVRTSDGWRLARIETVPVWLSGTLPTAS
jgi:SnoaL-like domain